MSKPATFNESLLHWLWKNRYLQKRDLRTQDGHELKILHPGYPNPTDGPDFTNARIRIGSLIWHGDIEIHWCASDWRHHNHHSDKNYNSVILHVVFDASDPTNVHRLDGTPLPTLCMESFLPKPLQYFFQHYRKPDTLPCAGNISNVPLHVVEEQFEHARHEYFEQKVNNLLNHYDAGLPLSKAWKKMLIINLFDGLGISHNRQPMRTLAHRLLEWYDDGVSTEELSQYALRISGIHPKQEKPDYPWKHKGSRPANHPKIRIQQGCRLLAFVTRNPFKWWLRTDLQTIFQKMIDQVNLSPGIGKKRSGVLFGVIWTPAFYLLGNLTGNKSCAQAAKEAWLNHSVPLPGSIKKVFDQSNFPSSAYRQNLGAVHQYRAYCKPHHCEQCKVFNFVISS